MKTLKIFLLFFLLSSNCFGIEIDNFMMESSSPDALYPIFYESDLLTPQSAMDSFNQTSNSVVGGTRGFQIAVQNEKSDYGTLFSMSLGEEGLSINNGAKTQSNLLLLSYDGDPVPGVNNFNGLNCLDLASEGSTKFSISAALDHSSFQLKIRVYDGRDLSGEKYISLSKVVNQINEPYIYEFPFSEFTGTSSSEIFSCVGAIELELVSDFSFGQDLILSNFKTDGKCAEIPTANSIVDDCGVCNGNNSSKDECGVCFGDGSSCKSVCSSSTLSVHSLDVGSNSLLSNLAKIKNMAINIKAGKRKINNLFQQAQKEHNESWVAVNVDYKKTVTVCSKVTLDCSSLDISSPIDTYIKNQNNILSIATLIKKQTVGKLRSLRKEGLMLPKAYNKKMKNLKAMFAEVNSQLATNLHAASLLPRSSMQCD